MRDDVDDEIDIYLSIILVKFGYFLIILMLYNFFILFFKNIKCIKIKRNIKVVLYMYYNYIYICIGIFKIIFG